MERILLAEKSGQAKFSTGLSWLKEDMKTAENILAYIEVFSHTPAMAPAWGDFFFGREEY